MSRRPAWWDEAACRGYTAIMFPTDVRDVAAAKAICAVCPVVDPCYRASLDHREPDGVWGGVDPDERRRTLAAQGVSIPLGDLARKRRRGKPYGTPRLTLAVERAALNGYDAEAVAETVGIPIEAARRALDERIMSGNSAIG